MQTVFITLIFIFYTKEKKLVVVENVIYIILSFTGKIIHINTLNVRVKIYKC